MTSRESTGPCPEAGYTCGSECIECCCTKPTHVQYIAGLSLGVRPELLCWFGIRQTMRVCAEIRTQS